MLINVEVVLFLSQPCVYLQWPADCWRCYSTACCCCWELAIFKPWVWTLTQLYYTVPSWSREVTATGWQHWIYVYHFTIMHFSNTGPLINYQNVKLRFMHGFYGSNGLFHVLTRRNVRSREVSKPWDLYVELSDRSEIWQPRQHCCRCACQNSKWCDHLNYPNLAASRLHEILQWYVLSDIEKVPEFQGQARIPIRFRSDSGNWREDDFHWKVRIRPRHQHTAPRTRHSAEKKQCISLATGIFWW